MAKVEVVVDLVIVDKKEAKAGHVFNDQFPPGGLYKRTLVYTVDEDQVTSFMFRKEVQDAKETFLRDILDVQAQITVKD